MGTLRGFRVGECEERGGWMREERVQTLPEQEKKKKRDRDRDRVVEGGRGGGLRRRERGLRLDGGEERRESTDTT